MATQALISAAEYLRTSFDGLDQEYYHGELVERGMPIYLHAKVQGLFCQIFFNLARTHRLFPAPEVRIQIDEGRIYRIPDVSVFAELEPEGDVVSIAPLVAIEISSPDDRLSNTLKKLEEYRLFGVRYIWFIDIAANHLYRYDESGMHRVTSLDLPEYDLRITLSEIGLSDTPSK